MSTKKEEASVVDRFIKPEQLKADLTFTPEDLTSAMMGQASMFAHYATHSANALRQHENLKLKAEIIESKTDKLIRQAMIDEGEKITEKKIEQAISLNMRVIDARRNVIEGKMVESLTKNALEAFKMRRDMLVQIGVATREEMKGELRVLTEKVNQNAGVDKVKAKLGKV